MLFICLNNEVRLLLYLTLRLGIKTTEFVYQRLFINALPTPVRFHRHNVLCKWLLFPIVFIGKAITQSDSRDIPHRPYNA